MDTLNGFIMVYVRALSVWRRIILWLMNWEGFGRNRSWPTRNAIHIYVWRKCEKYVRFSLFGPIFEPGIYRKRVESDTAAVFCIVVYLASWSLWEKRLLPFSCLSGRMEQVGSNWTDFHEVWHFWIFREYIMKVQVSLKSDKNNRYFTLYLADFFCGASTGFRIMTFAYGCLRSHSLDTPHSVGLLSTSDQLVAETST